MKADERQPEAAELEQWLRAVCDETEPTGEFQARLAADSAAAADFHDARDLVSELRAALRPHPMPLSLARAINHRIRMRRADSHRTLRFIAPLGAAAAAVLALAVATHYSTTVPQAQPGENTAVQLSTEDAADIVAANALLSWEGQFQTAVNELVSDIGDLQEATEQISQAGANLPWSAEDDWDAATTEGQSRAGFDCRA
jgi:hypothetical protein